MCVVRPPAPVPSSSSPPPTRPTVPAASEEGREPALLQDRVITRSADLARIKIADGPLLGHLVSSSSQDSISPSRQPPARLLPHTSVTPLDLQLLVQETRV
ncbi:hypothetical protein Pcinc_023173 [Petrolisthes cinctipes]|uniref:Uncharacterized protein n=1 Tax=Petrolisthes cinctipes TaxID=88211 RepID=A0AAE1FDG0_PETCI|nr:hypothetical protein Pcinc_023173 [Petrolisthes cinctipes]